MHRPTIHSNDCLRSPGGRGGGDGVGVCEGGRGGGDSEGVCEGGRGGCVCVCVRVGGEGVTVGVCVRVWGREIEVQENSRYQHYLLHNSIIMTTLYNS